MLNQQTVLVPRKGYNWPPADSSHTGEPYLAKVIYHIIPESTNQIGALESGLGDHCDCASGGKADARSKTAEEQPATRRLGATIAQVGDDGRADVWWDRHPRSPPALGANSPDRQSTSSRVSVATSSARKPSLASIIKMA